MLAGSAGDPRARLEEAMGGRLPGGVSELEAEHLEHLADAMAEARRRQHRELAAAGERALRFVPRFLRGPVRKVIG